MRGQANNGLDAAVRRYRSAEDEYARSLEELGVRFCARGASDARRAQLRAELAASGVASRNAGASLSWGWLSRACVECTGYGGSETFSTTFACHRDCYFCFNHNVEGYEAFADHGCPWEEGLRESLASNGKLACVGLTGGEPLLAFDDSLRFLERAAELFPGAHRRMYTSGDLLDESKAAALRDAGLDEIRFSVKNDDPGSLQERVLANMELAKRFIPDVVVEMPIVPGTGEQMHALMRRFDAIGISGMNLLEFCFPFHNWEEFANRGFEVRNPPFDVMYDYSYSGGLPIEGSEELALELMLWAIGEGLGFGLHYCSLDNKHRSEMLQKNLPGAHIHPCYVLDRGDFFLKTAKVYGSRAGEALAILRDAGCPSFIQGDTGWTAFPTRFLPALRGNGFELAVSLNVLEVEDGGRYLREVGVQPVD